MMGFSRSPIPKSRSPNPDSQTRLAMIPAQGSVRTEQEEREQEGRRSPATEAGSLRRVFCLGTLLILFNAWFGTYAYVVVQALIWTQTSLLRGPLVVLFFLVLINLL